MKDMEEEGQYSYMYTVFVFHSNPFNHLEIHSTSSEPFFATRNNNDVNLDDNIW